MNRPNCASTFAITLPSDPKMLTPARNFVEAVCNAYRLAPAVKTALILAAGEAFTNIIRHAHRHKPGAELQIHVEFVGERVVLTFHDEGEPFDIATVPHMNPSELRLGGRGVFMMRRLMDEVRSTRRQNGNSLCLAKRWR